MKPAGLSATVITRNEEANLARCLESLSFCDEIVVVDAGSTDRTAEIARQFTPHVHFREWTGYSDQKNFANSLVSHEWVLSVDADEEVTPELRQEIRETLGDPGTASAFSVPRKTLHSGRWIRHGGWYPNRLVRLFRKSEGSWVGSRVHERWQTAGDVASLEADLVHHSFRNIADQVERNNRYSTLAAESLQVQGKHFSLFRLCSKSFFKFLETYVVKRGFLDGLPGLLIAVSASYSVFLKWAKLWEMQHASEN